MDTIANHPAITEYETATAGIPDSFDCLTAQVIRDHVEWSGQVSATVAASECIRGYFAMLDTWYDAIDALDSELRCNVVAGALPDDQALYLKLQALALFAATTDLQRAVCEYHHGTAGPGLSEGYGHAYALSNSVLSPF